MIPNLFYFAPTLTLLVTKELWTWTQKSFRKVFGQKLITLLPGLSLNYVWGNNINIYWVATVCKAFTHVMLSYLILTKLNNRNTPPEEEMVTQKCSDLPKVIQENRIHHSLVMKRNLTMGNNLTGSFSLQHIIFSPRFYFKLYNHITRESQMFTSKC